MKQFFFAQKAFIINSGALLLVRKSHSDPNQPGKWEVPGGRMKFGEDVDEHLRREVLEEVGIDLQPGKPFYVWQWQLQRTAPDGQDIEMQIVAVARMCTSNSRETNEAGRESDDYLGESRWVPFAGLLEYDLIPNMVPVMQEFLRIASEAQHSASQ